MLGIPPGRLERRPLILPASEPQRGGGKRRASGRKDGLKDTGGGKLPQIVLRQEPMDAGRIGRL